MGVSVTSLTKNRDNNVALRATLKAASAMAILLIAGISLMVPDVVLPGITCLLHTTVTTIVKALYISFIVTLATQGTIGGFTGCHKQNTEYNRNTNAGLEHPGNHLLTQWTLAPSPLR